MAKAAFALMVVGCNHLAQTQKGAHYAGGEQKEIAYEGFVKKHLMSALQLESAADQTAMLVLGYTRSASPYRRTMPQDLEKVIVCYLEEGEIRNRVIARLSPAYKGVSMECIVYNHLMPLAKNHFSDLALYQQRDCLNALVTLLDKKFLAEFSVRYPDKVIKNYPELASATFKITTAAQVPHVDPRLLYQPTMTFSGIMWVYPRNKDGSLHKKCIGFSMNNEEWDNDGFEIINIKRAYR